MKRILFVDDEQQVLDGLRDLLRRRRKQWDMVFALGGEAALSQLAAGPFDIIVSDMRMPGMDGVALLRRVQKEYPNVVRMVLSGHAELQATLAAVPVAHQYLSKPVEGERLQNVLERTLKLHELLLDQALRRIAGQAGDLPSMPQVHAALTRALTNPEVSSEAIARIVEQDTVMCAEFLRLVNSAYFGNPRRITSIRGAVSYLGTAMIKNLVLSLEVFHAFSGTPRVPGFSLREAQQHSLLVARIAAQLLPEARQREDAFAAGILHDIGKLVLSMRMFDDFALTLERARAEDRPLHQIEKEMRGITHAELGAYLLGLWGFPYDIVEAVAYLHAPREMPQRGFDLLAATHVADLLAHEQDGKPGRKEAPDMDYLESLGVAGRLPEWRAIAAREAGTLAGADRSEA